LSDKEKIHNLNITSNQIKDLENKVMNKIEKEHSKINMQIPFRTDIRGEINTDKTAFSINNGKFEFLRMPFGLTNAPRIFQRAMNDILREQVGKTCHVYMDDIIIFSNTIEQHYTDLIQIINILQKAHMKISLEKFKFFIYFAFLGYIVSHNVIKTNRNRNFHNYEVSDSTKH